MTTPNELSFDEILKFMLAHNGKVTNHELVKHFKVFLMNPDMRDEARNTFKKHVNTLAIIKNQNNEKWLYLKKKYIPNDSKEHEEEPTPSILEPAVVTPVEPPLEPAVFTPVEVPQQEIDQPPYRPPPNENFSILAFNILTNIIQDCQTPSGNLAAEPLVDPKENFTSDDIPPKVHPRRKSSEKVNEKRSSINSRPGHRSSIPNQDEPTSPVLTASRSESMLVDNEHTISVKERKQMFNRMASESDVLKSNKLGSNFSQGVDEEDTASLEPKIEADPLDSRQKQWILCAARGEYHALAKMCKENPKLVKTKDPFTTAMHWACKRGDENLVKLLAGVTRQVVKERSGYTPLHIAMQFRHENVFRLLVEVYDADPNVRDWSGKKPRQYLVHLDTSFSPGSYRKADSLHLKRTVTTPPNIKVTAHDSLPRTSSSEEPDRSFIQKESFLRIGSLNVRVKKTTEAFSNFLGVGATRSSAYIPKSRDRDGDRSCLEDGDQLHKTWGSADNIQKEDSLMPPPMSGKVKRRSGTSRRGLASHSRSTPSTPDQPRAQMGTSEEGDSDSDSAAGFHSAWRQQRASCT